MKTNNLSIQDLMIGDWVMVSNFPIISTPMQIQAKHFVRSCLHFEPIPLTKDLLIKNGFEFLDEYAIFDEEEIYCHSDNEFYLSRNLGACIIDRIHYIHELQHFFKLRGIDKEWNV